MSESFGMMSDAYFVSRNEIITWVNELLDTSVKKIEELGSAALHCQILDAVYGPGVVPVKKVKFDAKLEHERTKNWKVVQAVFKKQGVQKVLPIDRLNKSRYQDNLEFAQWMYQFWKNNGGNTEYDGAGRRQYAGAKPLPRSNPTQSRPSQRASATSSSSKAAVARSRPSASTAGSSGASAAQKAKLQQMKQEMDELTGVAKDLEKERDFYFNKILQVETILKESGEENQELDFVKAVYEVLYAQDDDLPAEGEQEEEQ